MAFDPHSLAGSIAQEDGVRFGRTLLRAQVGAWAQAELDTFVLPGNRRGLIGVNLAGGTRVDGGLEVERALMAQAPLTLGTAASTDSGQLTAAGIRQIVHAIVADQLGDPPRESAIRLATAATMRELDHVRARRVGILPFGSGSMLARVGRGESVPIMIEEIVGALRRSASRIEVITFLCNSGAEVRDVYALLERIRRELWGTRA